MLEIVVLQNSWIVVGETKRNGIDFEIHNPAIIERYEDGNGITGVADNGPRNCRIKPGKGVIRTHELTIIMRLECNVNNWSGYHNG